MPWKKVISIVATLLIVLAAACIMRTLWLHYMDSPWTRDGRVRAEVVKLAPDVTGLVVEVPVKDNQAVKKDDLLLRIDPEHYLLAVKQAEAQVAARKAELAMRQDDVARRADLEELVVSRESRTNAGHQANSAQAAYLEAQSALHMAQLNLQRTEVRSPVDGYVTNLNLFPGDFAHRGEAAMAVVDSGSYYVYGYFEETRLQLIHVGDHAEMQLMSGESMTGTVHSIARAVFDRDNPESRELIADVNPTFNWVRLARRVPVRIKIEYLPDDLLLAAGLTCTVIITPTGERSSSRPQRFSWVMPAKRSTEEMDADTDQAAQL